MRNFQPIEQSVKDYQSGKNREENARLIYDCYHPILVRFFTKRGFPRDLCVDLTHDVFVRVFTHMSDFRGSGPFGAWLFKIANSVLNDYLRSQMAEKRKLKSVSLDGMDDDGENRSLYLELPDRSGISKPPDVAVLDRERQRLLDDALMKLPEKMRKCWIFREYHELSYKEIAVAMGGISVETVKEHLRQARAKLKAILAQE
jgi:RNA polymerase sigma-70 factor (ECF subfamily)